MEQVLFQPVLVFYFNTYKFHNMKFENENNISLKMSLKHQSSNIKKVHWKKNASSSL